MEKEVVVGVCSFVIGAFTAWSLMNNKVANTEKQKIRLETQLESFSNTQVFFQKISRFLFFVEMTIKLIYNYNDNKRKVDFLWARTD